MSFRISRPVWRSLREIRRLLLEVDVRLEHRPDVGVDPHPVDEVAAESSTGAERHRARPADDR
jgi:hypothetical protein